MHRIRSVVRGFLLLLALAAVAAAGPQIPEVPEPAAWVLMLSGVGFLAWRHWRRRG